VFGHNQLIFGQLLCLTDVVHDYPCVLDVGVFVLVLIVSGFGEKSKHISKEQTGNSGKIVLSSDSINGG
jgi:hypothetical protein